MKTIQQKRQYRSLFWSLWLLLTLLLCSYFYYAVSNLHAEESALGRIFLPGQTSDGHHQIEMACTSCHTEPFGGKEVIQAACTNCHADELKRIKDSHPKKKFTNPRNVETLSKLDARYCITCHTEHKPETTSKMGLTLPKNLCIKCHINIQEERVTHKDLDFNSCSNSGCHNYHDNKALYERFLLKHRDEPTHLKTQTVEKRDLLSFLEETERYPSDQYPIAALIPEQTDAPQDLLDQYTRHENDFTNKHIIAGVNCSACHQRDDPTTQEITWVNKPDYQVCSNCHPAETNGFLESKHGMRLRAGLSAMTPENARLAMKPASHGTAMTCMSCHSAHTFDTQQAATASCLQCHDDEHSNNYLSSPHATLADKEQSGELPANSSVTCSTCHLPRVWHDNEEEIERVLVDHNQNNTLRPNEKMLRPVCLKCHGLAFSIDALADPALIKNNFNGQPAKHINSIDMAVEAERLHLEKRKGKRHE